MSIHTDVLVVNAEVERRLELAGVHRDGHPHDVPDRPSHHRLAGALARLLGARGASARPVATHRPRHP
jgi:hypothetical protein